MPTYVYETLPSPSGDVPLRFQMRQGINDAPLATHPETGVPVRRVISGGLGFLVGGTPAASVASDATSSRGGAFATGTQAAANCGFACDCGF